MLRTPSTRTGMSAPTVPERTRTTVAPAPTAVIVPLEPEPETETIAGLSDDQVIVAVATVAPLASRAVAVTACVPPIAFSVTVLIETSTRLTSAGPVDQRTATVSPLCGRGRSLSQDGHTRQCQGSAK